MFKDVFVLKKTSWHVKMMKYIWNLNYYDFSHMCPYWWLTVFNHIVFIPIFIVKSIYKGCSMLANFIGSWFEALMDYYEQKRVDNYRTLAKKLIEDPKKVLRLSDSERQRVYNYMEWDDLNVIRSYYNNAQSENNYKKQIAEQKKEEQKIQKTYEEAVKSINDNKAANLASLEAQKEYLREQERIREEAERQRRIRNKQKITRILKIVKPILTYGAYTIGTLLVLIAVYYFGVFVVWSYTKLSEVKHSTYVEILNYLWLICKVIFAIGICALIIYFLVKWIGKQISKIKISDVEIEINIPNFGIRKFFSKMIHYLIFPFDIMINKGIIPFFRAIKNGIKLVIQMIKNECPAIKWED